MTMAEALQVGLSTTIIGLMIVFVVLIILMGVLMLFNKIFGKPEKKVTVEQPKPAAPVSAPKAEQIAAAAEKSEEELIAVLTAAVAASLNTSTYNLRIKSYRRIQNNAPAWNKAGIKETIESRF